MVDVPEYEQSRLAIVALDDHTQTISQWVEISVGYAGEDLSEAEIAHLRDLREAIVEATNHGRRTSIDLTVESMPTTLQRQGDRALRVAAELHRRRLADYQRDVLRPALARLLRDNGRFRTEATWAFLNSGRVPTREIAEALAAVAPGVLERIDIELKARDSTYRRYGPFSATVRALGEPVNAIEAAISLLRSYSDQLAEQRASQFAVIEVARALRGALGEEAFGAWIGECYRGIDWALGRQADDEEAALFGMEIAGLPASTLNDHTMLHSSQYLIDEIARGGAGAFVALVRLRAEIDAHHNSASWNVTIHTADSYYSFGFAEFDALVRTTLEHHWQAVGPLVTGAQPNEFTAALSHLPETRDWLGRAHGILLEDAEPPTNAQQSEQDASFVAQMFGDIESGWTAACETAQSRVEKAGHVIKLIMQDADLNERWSGRNPDRHSALDRQASFLQPSPPSPPPFPDLSEARELAAIVAARRDGPTAQSLVRLLGDFSTRAPGYIAPEPATGRYLTSIELFLDEDGVDEGFARLAANGGLDSQAAQYVANRTQGWRVAERLVIAHPEILDPSHLNAMPEQRAAVFRPFVQRLRREFTRPAEHVPRESVCREITRSLVTARHAADGEADTARTLAEFADGLAIGLLNESLQGDWYEQPAIAARTRESAAKPWDSADPSLDRVEQLAREIRDARSDTREYRRIAKDIDNSVARRLEHVEPDSPEARAFVAQYAELSARADVGTLLPSVAEAAQRLGGPDNLGPAQGRGDVRPPFVGDGGQGARLTPSAGDVRSGVPAAPAAGEAGAGGDAEAHARAARAAVQRPRFRRTTLSRSDASGAAKKAQQVRHDTSGPPARPTGRVLATAPRTPDGHVRASRRHQVGTVYGSPPSATANVKAVQATLVPAKTATAATAQPRVLLGPFGAVDESKVTPVGITARRADPPDKIPVARIEHGASMPATPRAPEGAGRELAVAAFTR